MRTSASRTATAAYPFAGRKALIGMVHLLPLPGSPGARGEAAWLDRVEARALDEARALVAAGFDAVVVENLGDAPYYPDRVPPETIASLARVVLGVVRVAGRDVPVGVNVLRNDARAALAVALAAGGRFVRVNVHTGAYATDQGVIEGRAHETLRERARLGASERIAIFADVLVKHARPLGESDPRQAAAEASERGLADALIVTGPRTGTLPDLAALQRVREGARCPILAGSGVTAATVREVLQLADGVIAGTALKASGDVRAPVDLARARAFVRAARGRGAARKARRV